MLLLSLDLTHPLLFLLCSPYLSPSISGGADFVIIPINAKMVKLSLFIGGTYLLFFNRHIPLADAGMV
jgi:hypothetical protein